MIFANAHPLEPPLFDDVSSDNLNGGTGTSGLFWPLPPPASSSIVVNSDENLLTNPPLPLTLEDDNNNIPVLVSSLPSCKSKRSFWRENSDDYDGLRARDGLSSSPSCASEPNLPLDVFSNTESYLRNNIHLNPPVSIDREVPDEYFEPLLLPDGSENDAAKLNPGEGDAGSPCAFPYIWHVCCDFSFGCRPSFYFAAEMVVDCMSGCHLSASHFQCYTANYQP